MELVRLRNATKIHHQKVEKDLDLLRPSFSLDDYIGLLRRFHGFHQPWEPRLETILEPELPGFYAPRRKLWNIQADLRYFGAGTQDLLRIAPSGKLPYLKSVGAALGALYVIEGASLGGRILTRHFGELLGVLPNAGCRFFSGYGERTGPMWSEFEELLTSRPTAEDDDMLEASISTFESLGNWLAGVDHA